MGWLNKQKVILPFLLQSLNTFVMVLILMFTIGWLLVLRVYVALAVFQPYSALEAGDKQSL